MESSKDQKEDQNYKDLSFSYFHRAHTQIVIDVARLQIPIDIAVAVRIEISIKNLTLIPRRAPKIALCLPNHRGLITLTTVFYSWVNTSTDTKQEVSCFPNARFQNP